MNNFDEIFTEATKNIPDIYFSLTIYNDAPIHLERVYCYELYHQLRSIWGKESKFTLNGEVYKGGHREMRRLGIGEDMPDLLVHVPGDIEGNNIIIEVKRARRLSEPGERQVWLSTSGVEKDLEVISKFMRRANYKRGIILIFGEHANLIEAILPRAKAIMQDWVNARRPVGHDSEAVQLSEIEVWHHERHGEAAIFMGILKPEGDDAIFVEAAKLGTVTPANHLL